MAAIEPPSRLLARAVRLVPLQEPADCASKLLLDIVAGGAIPQSEPRSFDLLDRFSVLVFSDDHPWSKPRPEPFLYALSKLGCSPMDSVHVGDLAYDVLGADRSEMRSILYTGLHRFEPEYLRQLAYSVDPEVRRAASWTRTAKIVRG